MKRKNTGAVRATTLLNKLLDLPGIATSGVSFPPDDPNVMVVDVATSPRIPSLPHSEGIAVDRG